MSNSVKAGANDKAMTIRGLLESRKKAFAESIPRHLSVERLISVAATSISTNPKLLECNTASLLKSVLASAKLGLEPDGVTGMAYLVPFRNKSGSTDCQLIPGYRGLLALARRSGEISTIYAYAVYPEDKFEYELGLDLKLIHVPAMETSQRNEKDLVAVYAVARFKDGGFQLCVMRKPEVEKVRMSSKSGNDGPWVTHYESMALKTALRRLCKMLPVSIEVMRAVESEERMERGETPIDITDFEEAEAQQFEEPPKTAAQKVQEIRAPKVLKPAPNPVPPPPMTEPPPEHEDLADYGDDVQFQPAGKGSSAFDKMR